MGHEPLLLPSATSGQRNENNVGPRRPRPGVLPTHPHACHPTRKREQAEQIGGVELPPLSRDFGLPHVNLHGSRTQSRSLGRGRTKAVRGALRGTRPLPAVGSAVVRARLLRWSARSKTRLGLRRTASYKVFLRALPEFLALRRFPENLGTRALFTQPRKVREARSFYANGRLRLLRNNFLTEPACTRHTKIVFHTAEVEQGANFIPG